MFGTTPVIPDAPTPASTAPFGAIYAGPEDPENHIGFIRANHDGRFEAFDTDKVLLGLFETFPSACDAIWTDCLGVKSRSNGGRPHARTSEEPDLQLKLAQSQSIAVKFLEKLRPGGPWVLSAIMPDGAITTITAFTADQVDAFVVQHNGKRNLYYSVNPTRTPLNKKAKKTDIATIEYALADLDPADGETPEAAKARYLKQLNGTFEPKPTAVIDSGNGIQGLWQLQERIALGQPVNGKFSPEDQAKIDDVEARTAAVMQRLGSKAGTQNIDRILRLPGTTNLPNAKKRKEGRVACPTKLLWFDDTSYPLDAFPKEEPGEKKPEPETFGAFEDIAPTDPRLAKLDEKWIALGFEGKGIRENYAGDRSRAVMAFACECVRASIVDKVIASCLMKWEIGRHIREQGSVERALYRTITRAHEFIANSPLFKMNERYAVLPIGGKTRVATWGEDPDFPGYQTITRFSPFDDFRGLHDKYRISYQRKDKGGTWRPSRSDAARGGSDIRDGGNTITACASCRSGTRTSSTTR